MRAIYCQRSDPPMDIRQPDGRHPTTSLPSGGAGTALLQRALGELEAHLPDALGGDPTAVHRARVASRRLREALPVTLPESSVRRKALRGIRRVTRTLGRVREMDVALGVLDELAGRSGIARDALEDVRARIVAERDRRRGKMLHRLRRGRVDKLGRRLQSVAAELETVSAAGGNEALQTRIAGRARRLRRAIDRAGRIYAPEGLHRVRLAVKKLRYALELAGDGGTPSSADSVRTLKRTQDTLGRLHDLQIVQQHAAAVLADPPARYGGSDGGLSLIASALEEECRHLHANYSGQVPALLAVVAECRTGLSRAARPPLERPPLKMLGSTGRRAPLPKRA